jgi:hypothetical protein
MAETAPLLGDWFTDTRTPVRRLRVTSHPDQGTIVLSLWQGASCTGTFRLPAGDAGRLVHALVDAAVAAPAPLATPAKRSWRDRVRSLLERDSPGVVLPFRAPD